MKTALINSTASTNAQLIYKNGTQLWTLVAFNSGAAAAYLKLYNKNAVPVVGTDTPAMTVALPPNSNNSLPIHFSKGTQFSNGIALGITALPADTDTTAVAASQVKVIVEYGG